MAKVEQITTIKIDDVDVLVTDTSPHVQQLVAVYNEWRQKAADAKDHWTMTELALRSLGVDIQNALVEEAKVVSAEGARVADDVVSE